MKNKFVIRILLLALLSAGLSSCGVWYNFKAYFNTYYNAKVLFDQVEDNVNKLPRDLFSFAEPTIMAQDYLALTKVNEKCSKILQFDTRSSYFIDALWLSGKSFYYQKEYVKAERKFKELLENVTDPEELVKVNLWLGKTELQLRNFDEGVQILDKVAQDAIKYDDNDIFDEAVIKQIAFMIYKERYAEAIDKCNNFLQNSKDKEVNAQVAYELGKFYYKNSDYQNAAAAFKSVDNYSPTFEVAYESKLEYAKCLLDMEKIDDGLSILNDLKNKSQYAKYLDEILVEIGTADYLKKDYENALDVFTKVDTLYYGTESSGTAEYMKGQLYEYHIPDFDSAAVYYDLANQNPLLSDDMKNQISKKSGLFSKYISSRDEIRTNQKQILYALDKGNYLKDSIFYAEAIYRDTTEQRRKMLAMQSGTGHIPGQTGQLGQNNQLGQNQLGQNNQLGQSNTGFSNNTMGNQGMTSDAGRSSMNSGANQQVQTPQNSLGMQNNNTNRQNQNVANQQGQRTGNAGYNDTRRVNMVRPGKRKNLPVKPVMPTISKDSLETILSNKYFNFGNMFFADMDLPDSAAFYYKKIINDYHAKSIAPNAYYALGTYYLTLDKKQKADSLFNIVYTDYPKSDVAMPAAKKLGLIKDAPSTDEADQLYIDAEKKYFDKDFTGAIAGFRNIISKYPKSKTAPKSAYYIAFIFENDLKNVDSTTAAYQFLNEKYPDSAIYAKVKSRYTVYEDAYKAKEKAAGKTPNPKPANPVNNQAKPELKDSKDALPDSIKVMMQKALQKEAEQKKAREQINHDSTKAVQKK